MPWCGFIGVGPLVPLYEDGSAVGTAPVGWAIPGRTEVKFAIRDEMTGLTEADGTKPLSGPEIAELMLARADEYTGASVTEGAVGVMKVVMVVVFTMGPPGTVPLAVMAETRLLPAAEE